MNYLQNILAHKRKQVAACKEAVSVAALEKKIEAYPAPRDFAGAISGDGISLIAEVKKSSPSAGLIRDPFHPVEIAQAYVLGGAAAISVLTDEEFFGGKMEHLTRVHDSCKLPCLQKDFIVDDYQLFEARAAGADAVLLIVAALPAAELKRLHDKARELRLHVLTEVHDETELKQALDAGASIIGINNRDLTRMETTLATTKLLVPKIPEDRIIVSESGIKTGADMQVLRMLGVDAALVGESLLKQENLETAVRTLMGGVKELVD